MTRINLLPKEKSPWRKFVNYMSELDGDSIMGGFLWLVIIVVVIFFIVVIPKSSTGFLKTAKSQSIICYENGYYEYDAGYCKRIIDGTTEVINIKDLY